VPGRFVFFADRGFLTQMDFKAISTGSYLNRSHKSEAMSLYLWTISFDRKAIRYFPHRALTC
jgi:hypothetical protein